MSDPTNEHHPFLSFLVAFNHDLRTPLNSIIGFSRVILKGIDGPVNDVQAEDLTSIHDGGQNMLAMLNEVIDMAKLEIGAIEFVPRALDLTAIFEETAGKIQPTLEGKSVTITVDALPEPIPVWADETRTRQIIHNIVSFCARNLRSGAITVRVSRRGDCARIVIGDNGEGWPQEEVAVMLESYRPPSQVQHIGGVGLSLAIARLMAEAQNGALTVESHAGRGTTFMLTLPLSHRMPPPEA